LLQISVLKVKVVFNASISKFLAEAVTKGAENSANGTLKFSDLLGI
jgi:hypothetical protein